MAVPYANEYQGMRWYRCDLHLHTPADLEWDEPEVAADEAGAEAWVRRCYDASLDVVAVTDHNFASKAFLPLLQEAAKRLSGEFARELVIFPGFEFELHVGMGSHALALFEVDSDLDTIDHKLTALGIGYPRFDKRVPKKSKEGLDRALAQIQRVGNPDGLFVFAHAQSNAGVYDDKGVAEWLQQAEHHNDDLLCVEVGRPVDAMGKGWQRLLGNGDDCDPNWKRVRKLACIQSSDAYRRTAGGSAQKGFVGKRSTWIKMSRPSIEALRQAFLDPDSRISFVDPNDAQSPDERRRAPQILALEVKDGRFLEDQTIHFAPGFTSVIGGRGAGKSSVLEYIRLALRRDRERGDKVARQVDRAKKTLGEDGRIRLTWSSADGTVDIFDYTTAGGAEIVGREVAVPEEVYRALNVQLYSQSEVSELTRLDDQGQPAFLLTLLDHLCGNQLATLQREAERRVGDLRDLYAKRRNLDTERLEIERMKQQISELDRKFENLAAVKGDADARRQALAADTWRRKLAEDAEELATDWKDRAAEVAEAQAPLGEMAAAWPEAVWFNEMDRAVEAAKEEFARAVGVAADEFAAAVRKATIENEGWLRMDAALLEAEQKFRVACEAHGLQAEDLRLLSDIEQESKSKAAELATQQARYDALATPVEQIPAMEGQLRAVWWEQHRTRVQYFDALTTAGRIPLTSVGRPFAHVRIRYADDTSHFLELWSQAGLPPDGRSRLGRLWTDYGMAALEAFRARRDAHLADSDSPPLSPWEAVDALLETPTGWPPELHDCAEDLTTHLREKKREEWERLRTRRVKDGVDLDVYRQDGTHAGSLAKNELSDGQRNTAILALLLADGNGPVVIDQPEDELDANFIFSELVPMLRRLKGERQVILATHNANLPVNGDADLVYALDVKDGHGVVRSQGGLDRDRVATAVLDIMEGSELAFRQRREKYGF